MMATYPSRNRPDEPYNALPMLPPKRDIETKAVLKATVEARVALAELQGAARTIPDDGILVRAIALQEARGSSEIERIVTTNDELYRALSRSDLGDDPQTNEVLRYSEAVWRGFAHIKQGDRFDASLFELLATVVLERKISIRAGSGTRIGDPTTGKVVYTPPIGQERILALLANLCDYLQNESETDPLVRLCVGHYQFEAIHPFPDANGRIGRILSTLFLAQQALLDRPILYLSRAILDDRQSYYRGLRRVTESSAWEPWILYMLDNIAITAVETRRRVEAIQHELQEATTLARASMTRGFSEGLIRLIFSQPYTRIAILESARIAKRQAASDYLKELERIGLLRAERRGREIYYLNDRLIRILEL